jgi:prophage tail gpP-like protein
MPSDVQIEIDGEAWDFWSSVTLTEFADSIAQVELICNFDPKRRELREKFKPFSYKEVVVFLGGKIRFIGTMMGVDPRVNAESSEVTVTAYALCGRLADVTATPEQFPTEYKNLNLDKIAKSMCEPIGIAAKVDGSTSGTPFEKIQLKPGQKILDLLISLAKQRSLIVTSAQNGDLKIYKPATNFNAVATLTEAQPVTEVTPTFDTQNYHTSITAISKTKGGKRGSKFTARNPFVTGFDSRPYVYELNDTDPADVPEAVNARLGRMFADTVSYEIEVATVLDQNGEYWTPDRFITLNAPGAMVYKTTPLYLMGTRLKFTPSSKTASLKCVLPGSLSGDLPESFPWDE